MKTRRAWNTSLQDSFARSLVKHSPILSRSFPFWLSWICSDDRLYVFSDKTISSEAIVVVSQTPDWTVRSSTGQPVWCLGVLGSSWSGFCRKRWHVTGFAHSPKHPLACGLGSLCCVLETLIAPLPKWDPANYWGNSTRCLEETGGGGSAMGYHTILGEYSLHAHFGDVARGFARRSRTPQEESLLTG